MLWRKNHTLRFSQNMSKNVEDNLEWGMSYKTETECRGRLTLSLRQSEADTIWISDT